MNIESNGESRIKSTALLALVALLAVVSLLVLGVSFSSGSIVFNGADLQGLPRVLAGTFGLIVGILAAIFAMAVSALAIAGSGILIFAILAFVGLILLAIAIPFLLPVILPILLVVLLLTRNRHKVEVRP